MSNQADVTQEAAAGMVNKTVRLSADHLEAMERAGASVGLFQDRDRSWLIRYAIETVYAPYFPQLETKEITDDGLQTSANEVLAGSMDNLTAPA